MTLATLFFIGCLGKMHPVARHQDTPATLVPAEGQAALACSAANIHLAAFDTNPDESDKS
jgi:hypothetical protein